MAIILLSASILILVPTTKGGSPPPPSDIIDGVQYIDGDWVVSGYENYSHEIIILTGNLTITGTGMLEFVNVTLKMNVTVDCGDYHIMVQDGGSFFVNDTDDDNTTTSDSSKITNNDIYGYVFQINETAVFEVRNSEIIGCGLLQEQADADKSGLKIMSNNVTIMQTEILDCANGFVFDSVNCIIENCTIYNNQYNGIYITNTSNPSHIFNITISHSLLLNNSGSGILYNGGQVNITLQNNTISENNAGGILVIGGTNINFTAGFNTIQNNTEEGGIGIWGIPSFSVIRVDVNNNNFSNNRGLSPIRVGFKFDEIPAKGIYANITDNEIWSEQFTNDGSILMYSSEFLISNITNNKIITPLVQNGVHIGKLSREINSGPAVKELDLNVCYNNITNIAAGAVRACAIDEININFTNNHVYHPDNIMTCGAVTIGWFKAGLNGTTPVNTTAIVRDNLFEGVKDTGAIGIKAIDNINATIENNTIINVDGGGIKVGWIDDADANNLQNPWAYPTKNVNAVINNNTISEGSGPGIWLYSSNGSKVMNNNITLRSGSFGNTRSPGDGIRIQSSNRDTFVSHNVISNCTASGFRAYNSDCVSVYSNVIEFNQYGIGLDQGSNHNILYNNIIVKDIMKYGYYIGLYSLNNSLPSNNTVNGEYLRYFHNLFGLPASHQVVADLVVNEPRMANLGQIIIANSTYVDIQNNTGTNGYSGITMIGVDNSSVRNNFVNSNTYGIRLQEHSSTNIILNNNINNNNNGIALLSSSIFNQLMNNTIVTSPSQTGIYFDTGLTTLDNELPINNTVNDVSIRYYHDESQLSLENLILEIPKMMNIGQLAIIDCQNLTIRNSSVTNGIRGSFIYESDEINLLDSIFSENTQNCNAVDSSNLTIKNVTCTQGVYNLLLNGVTNTTIENCTIQNGSWPLWLRSSSPTIFNSTIGEATGNSLSLMDNCHPILINCTYDQSNMDISPDSTLTLFWYLHVSVLANGLGIDNATVIVANSTHNVVYNVTTDYNGMVRNLLIMGSTIGHNYTTYYSPYHLNISKFSYENYSVRLDMNETTNILVNLFDIMGPEIIIGPTIEPAIIVTSSDILWLNASIDDSLRGNSAINYVECVISVIHPSLVNITPIIINAQDGAFDEVVEDVTHLFDISDWTKGQYTFWIRGKDSSENWCTWKSVNTTIFDNEGPAITSGLSISPTFVGTSEDFITLSLVLDDTGLGDSRIVEVECLIDGSSSSPILNSTAITVTALDGSFDQTIESVSVTIDISFWIVGQYNIQVRGRDEIGNLGEWSNITFVIVDDEAPSAPTNLMAVPSGEDGILVLTWSPNIELDLAGYKIYRSLTSGSSYQLVAVVGSQNTTWQDRRLVNGVSYFYVITAFDNATVPNESDYSNEASGTPNKASMNIANIWWIFVILPFLFLAIAQQYMYRKKNSGKCKADSTEEETPSHEPSSIETDGK